MTTPTDPLYSLQWHFNLIGDIETIWDEYSGNGVNVAVYDDGVESGHEDLNDNYDASLELVDNLGNPLPPAPILSSDGHGTACAGIIGAENNGIGGVGVAWGVTLTGVNIDFDNTGLFGSINGPSIANFQFLVEQATAFDVMSNSWGSDPLYQSYQSLTTGSFDDLVDQSYAVLATTGRGGLGTIIAQAAGNDNLDANGAGLNVSRFTITVAATLVDGMAASYSNFGASILVAAPAAAVTTDLSDTAVYPLSTLDVGRFSASAFADIDGDGDNDAVIGSNAGTLRTFLGDGAGGFTEVTGVLDPFNGVDVGFDSVPTLGDIDGDGDADMVVGADDGTLRTFTNNGTGVFAEQAGAANPFNGLDVGYGSSPGLGDLDGDGDLDMVTGISTGVLRTFLNNGTGGFTEAIGAANPFNGLDVGTYSTIAFFDLEGDGDDDAVLGAGNGTLRTFTNTGGVFTELTGAANPFAGVDIGLYSVPSFTDIDNDGDTDAMIGSEEGILYAYLNNGAGVFVPQIPRGYSGGNYTGGFGGTSAATPVVSGVVALMLEANAGLGWRDVQDILAASARLTGSALGAGPSSVEDGVWQTNGASTWNGGGYHLHANYGYGMVDAYAAVRMAEVWHLFAPAETSANEVLVQSGLNDFADTLVPEDGSAFTTTFTITGDVEIDHVALSVSFASADVHDLRVQLTSSTGTVIDVAIPTTARTSPSSTTWTYAIEGLRGELSAGTWTMTIRDTQAGNGTTVQSASLDIYGSAVSVDDVQHVTDEFLTMRGFQSDRNSIADTNGGIDWLNLAAVTGDVTLYLSAGGLLEVDGQLWAAIGGYENAVGGSGADGIFGSDSANHLHGMRGGDGLSGAEGTDTLVGGRGDDDLNGEAGDDLLEGGAGVDTLDGGTEFDTADYSGSTAGVTVRLWNGTGVGGDAQGDTLTDVEGVTGSAHNDTLIGRDGVANRLTGGMGRDFLNGLSGDDTLIGGAGNDSIDGGDGIDTADYAGSDAGVTVRLWNGTGVGGHAQGDTLTGIEAVTGSAHNDALVGRELAADRLDGGNGRDFLNGLSGDDTLSGGAANDTLAGGAGADQLDGGEGIDTADYAGSAAAVTVRLWNGTGQGGDAQGDTLTGIEAVTGSAHNDALVGRLNAADRLDGGLGNDYLSGLSGNDTLAGGAGADSLDGGDGIDTADYSASDAAVTVRLWNGTGVGGHAQGDTLAGFEAVTGSVHNDSLVGRLSAADRLDGGLGNDYLSGQSGDDTLAGGAGNDVLDGGIGADRFVFDTTPGAGNVDSITAFSVVDDTIALAAGVFGLAVGALNGIAFGSSASGAATTGDQRILYASSTGALFFDADGNGVVAAVQFATLSAGLGVTEADFIVI